MNLTSLLNRGRGLLRPNSDPFAESGGDSVVPVQPELHAPTPMAALPKPPASSRRRQSWFGWLFGNSRRHESVRLVQGELLLQQVKPVRNDFRDDDHPAPARAKPRVLWETPRQDAPRDDQDHAWNRLRNRRTDSLVVKTD